MPTTIKLDDDTAKAVEELRRTDGLGLSEAVNALIRRGMGTHDQVVPFRQPTLPLGMHVDVCHVDEALEVLEGIEVRRMPVEADPPEPRGPA
jgi:hypothetical protein